MKNNPGVRALDKLIDTVSGFDPDTRIQHSCGVQAFDELEGGVAGRTNRLSMYTIAQMALDNSILLYPCKVPLLTLLHMKPPFILCHASHFKTFRHTPPVGQNDLGYYLYDPDLGELPDPVYVITYQEPPAAMVLSKEEARLVKGARGFGGLGRITQQFTAPVARVAGAASGALSGGLQAIGVPEKVANPIGNVAGASFIPGSPLVPLARASNPGEYNAYQQGIAGMIQGKPPGGAQDQGSAGVDFGIPSPTNAPLSQAGQAVSGAVISGLQGGITGQLSQLVTPFIQPQFQAIEKQFAQQEKDLRARFSQAGFTKSSQLFDEVNKLRDQEIQVKQNVIAETSAKLSGEAANTYNALLGAGVQLDRGVLDQILGLTGLQADQTAFKLGLDYAKVQEAQQRYSNILQGVFALGGGALGFGFGGPAGGALGLSAGRVAGSTAASLTQPYGK